MGKICSGFGHSEILYHDNDIAAIEKIMRFLIEMQDVDTFYSGGRGRFDRCFALTAARLKSEYPHINNVLILSYRPSKSKTDSVDFPKIYDYTLYLLEEPCYQRYAITKTNRLIAEKSDFLIAGVVFEYGGAYQACKHAKGRGVPIFNIFHDINGIFPLPDIVQSG